MEASEITAVAALIISLLLSFKVLGLQNQLNDMKDELEWLNKRPESADLYNKGPAITDVPAGQSADYLSAELEGRLRMMLASGKKIKAIKLLREAKGLSLKEAKDFVDSMDHKL
ncbi:ribosomal protein L7/L12 [Paenibacillus dakarensis]|uniref:ribosomal protein L7/L12 n=1 Tax=Paenibacillus dakarensis TaxID=1527293 RepID=UPI0006D53D69|nr:ribosomal protein L7/L12 [Paenibacillus dakarensis]